MLRAAMEHAFSGSDAEGAWDWKTAYDSCEAATVLFLRKFGPAMRARGAPPTAMLPMLTKIGGLLPTHTRRSEESQAHQQFSTPITLGLAASTAAAITPADLVLEPSAGTGLLAILAELAGGALVLNELADSRVAGFIEQPIRLVRAELSTMERFRSELCLLELDTFSEWSGNSERSDRPQEPFFQPMCGVDDADRSGGPIINAG